MIRIVPIDDDNRAAFDMLMQCYEAEFSSTTEKMPGPNGLFPLDTHLDGSHRGRRRKQGAFGSVL
ncbi:hypothetical protein [Geobacter sp. DSM 9736]|uniref:hypothetical protein n=1 Tax=Geobacter sp. DSM 9736 TaxID=1277350 RepID=UPI000B500C68|nr:hypothetical protein [Geobacter sp. DSM 9736]SNB46112.1 hypothetical protein SAMN06269301_1554 [Geobacter sp. DSM 9736]